MTDVIAQLWTLPWWEVCWVMIVISWIALVKGWPIYLGVATISAVVLWWLER